MSRGTSWGTTDASAELDGETARSTFDSVARREMGISGDEFLARWDRGLYEGINMDDVPGLVATWMALPLVR